MSSDNILGKILLTCSENQVVKFSDTFSINRSEIVKNIDFKSDLNLHYLDENKKYKLKVDFVDEISRKTYTAVEYFEIHMREFQIQIIHSPKYFKIGIPFRFTILVTKVNGNPVLNSAEPFLVIVKSDKNQTLIKGKFPIDEMTGSVDVKTYEISPTTQLLKILVKYNNFKYTKVVNKSPSLQTDSIAINLLTSQPKMYNNVNFEIVSSLKSSLLVFQLFAKSVLKISKTISLQNGYANFSLMPKFSYTPRAQCIVFGITEGGSIISDSITINFENILPNYVSIHF